MSIEPSEAVAPDRRAGIRRIKPLREWGSPAVLRLIATIAALACVVSGIANFGLLSATRASLNGTSITSGLTVASNRAQGALGHADGESMVGVVTSTSPSSPLGSSGLNDALRQVAATADISKAATVIADADAAIVNYALAVEDARDARTAGHGTGALASTVDPYNAAQATLAKLGPASSTTDILSPLLVWLPAIIPLGLLVACGVWLAKRTRRVLNVGLVAALLLSVGGWVVTDTAIAEARDVVSGSASTALVTSLDASNAARVLGQAHSAEGRALVGVGGEDAWGTTMATLDTTRLSAHDQALIRAYTDAHKAAFQTTGTGRTAAVKASGSSSLQDTYQAAYTSLAQEAGDARVQAASQLSTEQSSAGASGLLAFVLQVVAALAAIGGVRLRLAEYQ